MDKQLIADLKAEIDTINAKIETKEAERKAETDVAEKAVILDSINVLNDRLTALIAERRELTLKPPATSQGKICIYPSTVIPTIFELHYSI